MAGKVMYVMAVIMSARRKLRSKISRPTGVIIAPPSPCTTRMPTSMGKSCAMPHRAEPRVNTASAATNTRRAPKRSANQPLTGMNTATAST